MATAGARSDACVIIGSLKRIAKVSTSQQSFAPSLNLPDVRPESRFAKSLLTLSHQRLSLIGCRLIQKNTDLSAPSTLPGLGCRDPSIIESDTTIGDGPPNTSSHASCVCSRLPTTTMRRKSGFGTTSKALNHGHYQRDIVRSQARFFRVHRMAT